jgi:hypothetical protein
MIYTKQARKLITPEMLRTDYNSGMTQIEVAKKHNTTWRVIHHLMIEYGVKSRPYGQRGNKGEKNRMWKGDNAGYSALHFRVEKQRGKPRYCEVCETYDAKKYEWANLTGHYADVNDYKRMCVRCHQWFDGKDTKNSRSQFVSNTKILTEETLQRMPFKRFKRFSE